MNIRATEITQITFNDDSTITLECTEAKAQFCRQLCLRMHDYTAPKTYSKAWLIQIVKRALDIGLFDAKHFVSDCLRDACK